MERREIVISFDLKHIIISLAVVILLIAANVYQWQHPKVIEIPSDPVQIDSTAWVQKSEYNSQKRIIKQLEAENESLAERVRQTGDKIAYYTAVNGKLNLQVDSLKMQKAKWREIPKNSLISEIDTLSDDEKSFLEKAREDLRELKRLQRLWEIDTTFTVRQTYGDGLFLVTGYVHFRNSYFRQELELEQLRDIRLSVTNTISKDHSRILTYVYSPDFENLEYKSYTTLQPKRKLPWFWIGLGAGVVGTAIILK